MREVFIRRMTVMCLCCPFFAGCAAHGGIENDTSGQPQKAGNARALHEAATRDDPKKIKTILDSGVDVNARDEAGRTALHYAAMNGRVAAVKMLLSKGADITIHDNNGAIAAQLTDDPAGKAYRSGNLFQLSAYRDIMMLLAPPDQVPARGDRLHGATEWVRNANLKPRTPTLTSKKEYIAGGGNVNALDRFGLTMLHSAAQEGQTDQIEWLLLNGADVNAHDFAGRAPLHLTAEHGWLHATEMLLDQGANVDALMQSGITPLHLVAGEWYRLHALEFGGDGQRPDFPGTMSLLLKRGADVNAEGVIGDTALHLAAQDGAYELVQLLLTHGADPNKHTKDMQNAPLHFVAYARRLDYAAERVGRTQRERRSTQYVKCAKILLDHGASIDSNSKWGTPLQVSIVHCRIDLAELFLRRGADRSLRSADGKTLHELADDPMLKRLAPDGSLLDDNQNEQQSETCASPMKALLRKHRVQE